MRRWRLVVGAAVVAVIGLGVAAGPASAAAPTGSIDSPTDNAVLTQPALTVSGSFSQPSTVSGPGTVDQVHVWLVAKAGQKLPDGSEFTQPGGSQKVSFNWTTPELPYNGAYELHAQATGTDAFDTNGQETSAEVIRHFSLDVPPAPPTGLKIAVDSSSSTFSLTWDANPEPDLIGYQVQREADGTSSFDEAGQTTSAAFTDKVAPGTWKYRIVAVRQGAQSSELLASNPGPAAAGTMTSPPSTTAAPSGTAGGDTSGGTATSGGSTGGSTGTTSASNNPAIAKAGKVDFSAFSALLDTKKNRSQARLQEPDPGYQETLPFQPGKTASQGGDDLGVTTEAGGESPGTASRLIVDRTGERRHRLSYVAGALLMFVLMMHVLWLRAEVDRLPVDLEATEPEATPAAVPTEPYRARRAARVRAG